MQLRYSSSLKLKSTCQNQRVKLSHSAILLQDNPHPQIAALTNKIQDFRWTLFNHTPYNPNFSSSDLSLLRWKQWIGEQLFENSRTQNCLPTGSIF